MIQIEPISQTGDPTKIATQLEVNATNPTDVSIYAAWELIDANNNYVNNGTCQLIDDSADSNNITTDYTKYLSDNSYLYTYVINILGLTVLKNQ